MAAQEDNYKDVLVGYTPLKIRVLPTKADKFDLESAQDVADHYDEMMFKDIPRRETQMEVVPHLNNIVDSVAQTQ